MAAFNAELAAKALERRVNGLESQVDAMNKASRAAGDQGANVAALQKQLADQKTRIEVLEKMVKALTDTRGDSKSVALEKLGKTVEEIANSRKQERIELLAKFNQQHFVKSQDVTRLVDEQIARAARAEAGVQEARRNRERAEADRKAAELFAESIRHADAQAARAMREQDRLARDMSEKALKTVVDAQLTTLSARIAALEGELKRR